jgi:hypothetical protein
VDQRGEWSSNRPRSRTRLLGFEVGLLAISAVAALAVYLAKVLPLSAAPVSPPSGIVFAWAGQQLRGYTETNYIAAESCEQPVKVLLDLYRTGIAPEPEYTQGLRPGRVAFVIAGDPELRPEDVRVWAPRPGQEASVRLLYEPGAPHPPPLPLRAQVRRNSSTGEQESIAFTFNWNPITQRRLKVFFKADWLSPRTSDRSCWLTVPGQLDDALDAVVIANAAIGHAEWSRSYLGQPLFNAATFVNINGGGGLLVNSPASIPSPSSIEPASWNCGGFNFQSSSCQAAVALEPPNAESSRSEQLVFWSTLGGLLLSICGGAFIAAIRQAMKRSTRSTSQWSSL